MNRIHEKTTVSQRTENARNALAKHVEKLKHNQAKRAVVIEGALQKFEENIRVETISEYKILVEIQRGILGLDQHTYDPTPNFSINIDRSCREKSQP